MATKKQLVNRWLEEPGRSIALRISEIMICYQDLLRPLEAKAFEKTGRCFIPDEWLPTFSTKTVFDLLNRLSFRDEVSNGRDLRAFPSAGGLQAWDLRNTDVSYLPGLKGYIFYKCNLDGAVFDGSKGEFEFRTDSICGTRFRKVHFSATSFRGVDFCGDCLDCDFTEATMKKASFSEFASLRGSVFTGANLKGATLDRCDLRGCDFRKADLSKASINEAILDKTTDFRGANLAGLHWQARHDNAGKLVRQASDWRQGTYDSTTIHD